MNDRVIDPEEVVEMDWVRIDKCLEMIVSGEISGSFSILAILAYKVLADTKG